MTPTFVSLCYNRSNAITLEQVVFLLEDFQFVDPAFLELINSLVSAGEVPGLYSAEELDTLLAPLRDEASDAGHRGPVYTYFAKSRFISQCGFDSLSDRSNLLILKLA